LHPARGRENIGRCGAFPNEESPMPPQPLTIDIRPYDPSARALAAAREQVERVARRHVGDAQHRVLTLRTLPPQRKTGRPARPSDFHAVVYDYSGSRALDVHGSLRVPDKLEVVESARQPGVSHSEYEAAVDVVRRSREFGPAIREGRLSPYKPMPPHVPVELPDGTRERRITVGLLPAKRGDPHEIVAVDLARKRVDRFEGGAPERALAAPGTCGVPPNAEQATADQGTPGQALVTVSRGSTVLWELLAVRPAASSGYWGSGLELRNVSYKGRSVLFQAHVPILNVRYDRDACGPYRDWQWQEGMIQANGVDVAPGFRLCTTPAKTILETGSDTGNFLGVGVYAAGQEVVLVSEMEAGWYRYLSEWRLHADGRIQPRFGFAATQDSCVCNVHHHHVYWRFDFDIGEPANVVREFNDPPVGGGPKWTTMKWEAKRFRAPARKRRWRVQNRLGQAYDILPGESDGTARGDAYSKGDFWALRYRPDEIDDHPIVATEAELDRFVQRLALPFEDVVVWYGAHFEHDVRHHGPADPDHIVGPTLVPRRWS
jgi:hypothetical protein